MSCLLNIDLGELPGEDEALYALAHVANIACGGHAGDAQSIRQALEACARHGTRVGAHPSFVDREGFGRRELPVPPATLEAQVAAQCALLAAQAGARGLAVTYAKPHGALYHAASREDALARAVVGGIVASLGRGVVLIGPPAGALAAAARQAGLGYAREGFADRGRRPDGTLVPRGQPGALVSEPAQVRESAVQLATGGALDTLCVHGDTPGALALAREVRTALDALALSSEALGEAALRLVLPGHLERRGLQEALRRAPGVRDVVLGERHACLHFDPAAPPGDVLAWLARELPVPQGAPARPPLTVRVRYDGPDLGRVAAHAGLTPAEVVRLHAAREYSATAVGFLPGFAYLAEVDARIAVPRLASPRPRVPALAVGIAGRRTGIYPFASPGGWNLVGTALDFVPFSPGHGATLQPGDRVRLEPVP